MVFIAAAGLDVTFASFFDRAVRYNRGFSRVEIWTALLCVKVITHSMYDKAEKIVTMCYVIGLIVQYCMYVYIIGKIR